MYPLLLFCGGVHGGAVVLGGTNPIVVQNMTENIRVAALLFFRNGDTKLLFSKSKSLETLISFLFRGYDMIEQIDPRWGIAPNPNFQLKCLHSLLGEARLLDASKLENDHNSWSLLRLFILIGIF